MIEANITAHGPVASRRHLLMAGAAVALSIGASAAQAQSTDATDQTPRSTGAQSDDTADRIPDIIVTAEKRDQRQIDVPSALSVVSSDQLAQANIKDTTDLTRAVPSLAYTAGVGSDQASIRIRGIGTQVFSIGVEPSVSYVVDGVVLARESQALGDLSDVKRVEVLRGPQSTLFGKNASAGVISIVTKDPTDTLSIDGSYTYIGGGDNRLHGAVSGPISDTLGFRLTAYSNTYDGFIRNVNDGERLNGTNHWGVRGKLRWEPTDRLTLTAIGDYSHQDDTCCEFSLRKILNPATLQFIAPVQPGTFNREVNVNAPVFERGEQGGVSLQANYDLDNATLTSISSYRHYRLHNNTDIDNTPLTAPTVGVGAYATLDFSDGVTESDTFTQELRINSTGERQLDYVFGLFYFDTEQHRPFAREAVACAVSAPTAPVGTPCPLSLSLPAGFDARVHNTSTAAFGDLTYKLTPRLSLIGGLRANYETLSYDFSVYNTPVAVPPVTVRYAGDDSVDDTVLLGRGGVKLQVAPETNIFALYSHGYKGYAFDLTTSYTPAIGRDQPISPETSNAYEINLKSNLFDRRLTLKASLFRTDYKNFQVQAFDTVAASFRLLNAGRARTEGVELEATARPFRGFSLTGGFTYAEARVREFPGGPCYAGQPLVDAATGEQAPLTCANNNTQSTSDDSQNLKGARLPNAPDWRYTIDARYEHALPGTGLDGNVDIGVNGQSSTQFALNQNPGTVQKGYLITNASIGIADQDDRFDVSVFVHNLFDQHYASALFEAPLNNVPVGNFAQILTHNAARYYGIRLSGHY